MKLSILDQSPVSAGSTAADALRHTIDLSRLADRLGYERFWIAEHHAMETLASPAPEILLARIGAETSGIRIGSGAVLLPHYSPFKVAEVFRMLHAMYPDRIDLGLGRAPGGSALEMYALRRDRTKNLRPDDFLEQLAELQAFLHREFPVTHPFHRIHVAPDMPGAPEVWLLGSSQWSAEAAAALGLPYAFAHFIGAQSTHRALRYYNAHFTPSARLPEPHTILALGVVCAETEAEAERLFASARLLSRQIRQGGRPGVLIAPEDALKLLGSDPDPPDWPGYVRGTPEQVRDELTRMAEELHVDEVMAVTVVHDPEARLQSYRLLAQAFDLAARPTPGVPSTPLPRSA